MKRASEIVRGYIAAGEGQRIEFKQSLGLEKEILRSIGALANSDGGVLLIGVKDDKTVVGVDLGRNTLENLANNIGRETQAPIHPQIDEVVLGGRTVITVRVAAIPKDDVAYACGVPWIRVGKTNQAMTPAELRTRYFTGFKAENTPSASALPSHQAESWTKREERRVSRYQENRGLFIAHNWQPSTDPEQVADIVIYLHQHAGEDEPLAGGSIKSVEWHLGPKFFNQTVVKTEAADSFRVEVSAYGPLLCLARVNFDDGHAPIDLERYINF